ncbi:MULTISPECIES: hypothetical protein [unclassified Psychrobacter]|uniref:hypothetical protein n=1 Tax=unclassified Psychrobacter TaxID=196806 RepID=UPI0018F397B6|nr:MULTISPECIES: hypothetical protein [unclassified Psychrobacter]
MTNNHTDNDKVTVDPANTDTNGRQSDIYARFLEQMQRIDSGSTHNADDKTEADDTAYELLSEEELQMFADFDEQTAEMSARYDAEHPEEVAAENQPPPTFHRVEAGGFEDDNAAQACPLMTVEPPAPNPHILQPKKPVTKTSKHLLRGLMLLAIGIVSGVIISALAILALNPDAIQMVMGNDAEPTIETANAPASAKPATAAVAQNAATANNATNTAAATEDNMVETVSSPAENSAISYEDFREESQTTLYRDTSK